MPAALAISSPGRPRRRTRRVSSILVWLTAPQALIATQVTNRFPFNHGAPIHIGDPEIIGADLANPLFGPPVGKIPDGLVPVFWACGVTPQEAALAAAVDLMITHAPAHGFISDLRADEISIY